MKKNQIELLEMKNKVNEIKVQWLYKTNIIKKELNRMLHRDTRRWEKMKENLKDVEKRKRNQYKFVSK